MGERSLELPDSDTVRVGTIVVSCPSKGEADAEGGMDAPKDETTVVAKAARERERDVFMILKLG
jgi:hypothetical protein